MSFDPTKPVQTRDGCKARIICTDRKGRRPIIALVYHADNSEELCSFLPTGRDSSESFECGRDLINIPEKRKMTVWVNVYPRGNDTVYGRRYDADAMATPERTACVPVEIEYEV